MQDQQVEWINNSEKARLWAMTWVTEAKEEPCTHTPVKRINEAASSFKNRFCTDGFWSPGAEVVYNTLKKAECMAQHEYESHRQTSM